MHSLPFANRIQPIVFASLAAIVANSTTLAQSPEPVTDSQPSTTIDLEAERTRLNAASTEYFVMLRPGTEQEIQTHNSRLANLGRLRGQIALADRDGHSSTSLRAQFAKTVDDLRSTARSRTASARLEAQAAGALFGEPQTLVPGFILHAPTEAVLARLHQRGDVLAVTRATWQRPSIATAMSASHHNGAGAHALMAGTLPVSGKGVGIAVIDSGLDMKMGIFDRPHRAFFVGGDPNDLSGGGLDGSRIQDSFRFTSQGFQVSTEHEDIHGHGTRVASTIAAAKWSNGLDVANSAAFGADLYSYKISEDSKPSGFAHTHTMATAFEHAALGADIQVANMSYDGAKGSYTYLTSAIDNAVQAGIFVSLSAGNFGSDLSFAHGSRNAMIVGASYEHTKAPAPFSAVGPLDLGGIAPRQYPDMLAQGTVVSTATLDADHFYTLANGASLSSGFVAGAAALMFQADPTLTAYEVRAMMVHSLKGLASGDPAAGGYGYLNIRKAVQGVLDGDVLDNVLTAPTMQLTTDLMAGDAVKYTMAFNRSGFDSLADIGFAVVDPNGVTLAATSPSENSLKQLQFTATVTGQYEVVVSRSSGASGSTPFAIAGLQESGCNGGTASLSSFSPTQIPAYTPVHGPTTMITVAGCNLSQITGITVDGFAVDFEILGNTEIAIQAPNAQLANPATVVMIDSFKSQSFQIATTPVGPSLEMPLVVGPGTTYPISFGGSGGRYVFLVGSLSNTPSLLPGVYDLAIGAASSDLFLLLTASIPVGKDVQTIVIPPLQGTLGVGPTIYTQALMLDSTSPALPFDVSNMQSTGYWIQ